MERSTKIGESIQGVQGGCNDASRVARVALRNLGTGPSHGGSPAGSFSQRQQGRARRRCGYRRPESGGGHGVRHRHAAISAATDSGDHRAHERRRSPLERGHHSGREPRPRHRCHEDRSERPDQADSGQPSVGHRSEGLSASSHCHPGDRQGAGRALHQPAGQPGHRGQPLGGHAVDLHHRWQDGDARGHA